MPKLTGFFFSVVNIRILLMAQFDSKTLREFFCTSSIILRHVDRRYSFYKACLH